jgi:pSer/pThr/pTyr-binding forkhead associated (FHA) protein
MVQLNILTGKKAGASWVARRFPVHVGRAPDADLPLDEDGVWDQHLRLDFERAEGFHLTAAPEAMVWVNSQPVRQTLLRNGDVLEFGAVKLRFWLAETRQQGLFLREAAVWTGIAVISLVQVGLIYWLLK